MSVTPEIEAEIMRSHAANPRRFSPFRVARAVGATIEEVTNVVAKNRVIEDTEFGGSLKRPELERYIVASRRVSAGSWDNTDVGIIRARRNFEAGTHDMATHREGPWLHLCSFPLARPRRARPGYFIGGRA